MKNLNFTKAITFILFIAACFISCKKNSANENNPALKTPLVTSLDVEQIQPSTLSTRYSLAFDYADTKLTKIHRINNGVETQYVQLEYGTVDNISYAEHHTLNAFSGYSNSSSPDLLDYREDFTYNQNGNLDTYSTREYFYGNGYNFPENQYVGSRESYTYNSDGSVSVKVYSLFSINGNVASEAVKAIGNKVISFPAAGVKKVVYTNTASGNTVTYTYNYDSKNNPFKNITGSFQKLWVTPSYGVGRYDNGLFEETNILGDIYNVNNLLSYTGSDNGSGHYSCTYNSNNYPVTESSINYTTITYHYNQ